MDRTRLLLCGLGILIIACASFFAMGYYLFRYPYLDSHTIPKETNAALVIDFNNDKEVTEKQIMDGRDAVIVIQPPSSNNQPWFDSLEALLRLDINPDGNLNPQDPLYSHIRLVFINGRHRHRSVSLTSAGVQSVNINKRRLVVMIESDHGRGSRRHSGVVGLLRMNDGVAYDIWLVHIGQQTGNLIMEGEQ